MFFRIATFISQMDADHEVTGPLASVEEVTDYLEGKKPHPYLIISDIKLSDGLVFEAFERIKLYIPVIFTTAYDDHAIAAFRYNSIDYLLKPVKKEELEAALHKYRNMADVLATSLPDVAQMATQKYRKRILCPYVKGTTIIQVEDISYIRTEASITTIYLKGKKDHYHTEQSLTDLEKQLDPTQFFRANKKDIINISEVADFYQDAARKTIVHLKNTPRCGDCHQQGQLHRIEEIPGGMNQERA